MFEFALIRQTLPKVHLVCRIAILLLAGAFTSAAIDWPQWRGPHFNGSTTETNLLLKWNETNGVLWKTPLPGPAASTPITWGGTMFLTSPDDNKDLLLLAFDAKTGRERWRRVVGSPDRSKGRNNNSSPSPCTDGKRVYVMFATGDIAAFDFDGKKLWARNLEREYGGLSHMWIYGASPLLYGDRLYVPLLQRNPVPASYTHAQEGGTKRESFLLCIDPATGTNLWRHLRVTGAENESMESYTTPIPHFTKAGVELLLFGANHVTAHDPASGRELWRSPDLNPKRVEWWRVVPSPVVAQDTVVVCGPRREPVFGIVPGTGAVAWEFSEYPSDCPSPVVWQDRLFVLDGDRQVMTRLNPKTGEKIWQGNLGVREVFRASPLAAEGRIYCVSESGTVVVLGTGEEFQILSTNPAPAGEAPVRSLMIAVDGRLFLRTAKHLVCLGTK